MAHSLWPTAAIDEASCRDIGAVRIAVFRAAHQWQDSASLPWGKGVERFFAALQAFDAYLAADLPLLSPAEKLFQGPVADALALVGQIAMLRRLAGAPVRGENYFRADIVAGRVGAEQSAPVREFE